MGQEDEYVDLQIEEQKQIAEHVFGMVARRVGERRDETKSEAWLRGWDEAGLGQR
jgi:hypothetical protein